MNIIIKFLHEKVWNYYKKFLRQFYLTMKTFLQDSLNIVEYLYEQGSISRAMINRTGVKVLVCQKIKENENGLMV